MTRNERVVEKIALLLLDLKFDDIEENQDQVITLASNEAADLAIRATRGWWEIPGKPYYTSRLKSIQTFLKRTRKTAPPSM